MFRNLLLITCAGLLVDACASAPTMTPAQPTTARLGCTQATGSNLPPDSQKPCPGPGSTYNQDDLSRTGQTQTGAALRMLDPSLTVHGQ
jgi:hypothetical protein